MSRPCRPGIRALTALLIVLAPALVPGAAAQSTDTSSQPADVQIRGFGDFAYKKEPGEPAAFTFGQFDAFVTATISERVSVLIEAVAESGHDNHIGIDLERAFVRYTVSDLFRVGLGRYHTSIGYYSTAYHHGMWFQTAATRPELFAFEDDGGPLPVHQVGLLMDGRIRSGAAGLRWFAEVGNGRTDHVGTEVQNASDSNSHKALALTLTSQPAGVRGLTLGASYYTDRYTHEPGVEVREHIASAFAVLMRHDVEWLGEVARIQHQGTVDLLGSTWAGYAQAARKVGPVKPFGRFEYFKATGMDQIEAGKNGPTVMVGVRRELAPRASLKIQVQTHRTAPGQWSPGGIAQVAYAF